MTTHTSKSPECRYLPDRGHGDVILVGDSHAAQWFPAVELIARSRGWGLRVWTRAACSFADVQHTLGTARARSCDTWRATQTKQLISAHPSLVIVSSYASVLPTVFDPTTGELLRGTAALAVYEAGFQRELAELRAAGLAVLVIRDNPSFAQSGPQCLLLHAANPAACSEPRSSALAAAADLQAAHAVAGVGVADFTSTFCTARRCHQVIGSTLAYRDENHLTIEIVLKLAAQLEAAALRTVR
jgi:hypothetical protein